MSVVELEGQDPETGHLFQVPRVAVLQDTSDPTILKLAFSGSYELDREDAGQVAHYNRLRAGQESVLSVTVRVAGSQKAHRLDSEGDPSDIVESKRLVVGDVYFQGEEAEA